MMVSIYTCALFATLMRVVGAQLMTPRTVSPQIIAHRGATGISFIDINKHFHWYCTDIILQLRLQDIYPSTVSLPTS
jgi:hypothetical protein